MKKGLIGLTIAAIGLLLAACATEQYYASAVNSWQGATQQQVYSAWGYPNHIRTLPNGHKLLVYRQEEKGRNPVYETPGSTTVVQNRRGGTRVIQTDATYSGGGTYDYKCTTWFEIARNRVVNTSYRGNNCVATKDFMLMHTYVGAGH